ncbi:hypothetical protein [Streptomyces olivaceiscleroticus]|uniref:Uncharacterized protein n=1 Tax=Streptomyces olivaceiscleroticus TaxID=68245 RepID=A0ABN1A3X0_9ACTN
MATSHIDPDNCQQLLWGAPGSALEKIQSEIARRIAEEMLESDRQALEFDAKSAFRAMSDPRDYH